MADDGEFEHCGNDPPQSPAGHTGDGGAQPRACLEYGGDDGKSDIGSAGDQGAPDASNKNSLQTGFFTQPALNQFRRNDHLHKSGQDKGDEKQGGDINERITRNAKALFMGSVAFFIGVGGGGGRQND